MSLRNCFKALLACGALSIAFFATAAEPTSAMALPVVAGTLESSPDRATAGSSALEAKAGACSLSTEAGMTFLVSASARPPKTKRAPVLPRGCGDSNGDCFCLVTETGGCDVQTSCGNGEGCKY